MVIVADGLRILITAKSVGCFTGIFTVPSESELPNLMVTGVLYQLLTNFTKVACAIQISRLGSGYVGFYVSVDG